MAKQARDLTKSIRTVLELHGWMVWKAGNGAVATKDGRFASFGEKGAPDLFALRGGALVGLEIKASKGDRLQPSQIAFADKFMAAGGRYFEVRSLDDVAALLPRPENK